MIMTKMKGYVRQACFEPVLRVKKLFRVGWERVASPAITLLDFTLAHDTHAWTRKMFPLPNIWTVNVLVVLGAVDAKKFSERLFIPQKGGSGFDNKLFGNYRKELGADEDEKFSWEVGFRGRC